MFSRLKFDEIVKNCVAVDSAVELNFQNNVSVALSIGQIRFLDENNQ